MKFFIPERESREEAEKIYAAIRAFAREQVGHAPTARRIFQVDFTHNGRTERAVVGEWFSPTGEIVVAILEASYYLVCTPNRGVYRGLPILVGHEDIIRVVDFERDLVSDEGAPNQ